MASAYCYNKILGSADNFQMFVRGFNMGHLMCDFVDAGDGKECVDSKLKGNISDAFAPGPVFDVLVAPTSAGAAALLLDEAFPALV
jgi:hypothetical protein